MTTTTEQVSSGFGLQEGEGEAIWLIDNLATVKISGRETGGRYALVEFITPAGSGSPYHVHHEEDEWFYVLEGEMTFYVGDAVIPATKGSFAFGPRNVPHTFVVDSSTPARYLLSAEPAGFERFLAEAGTPAEARTLPPPLDGPPDVERLAAIGAKYGIEMLGPPGPPPSR